MKIPFVDLQAQHRAIHDEVMLAVEKIICKGNFVLGEEVGNFETEFASFCGTRCAVGVDSGLSALQLALEAFGIGPGDEVLVPANTFIATAAAVTFAGARPVLVDIDPDTYNLDLNRLESAITPHTKAIIPVHLYGLPVDMYSLMYLADRYGLIVIEDACQAHGAYYKGRRVGSMGHAGAFSFYPAKNLGACGDAGMLVTDDPKIDERVRAMRNCGQTQKYYHTLTPYNHRLDTLQAAILSIKLKYIDDWNSARRQHAAEYNKLLNNSAVVTPVALAVALPVWHLYVIRTEHRDELRDHLAQRGIGTGIHYPVPIHLQPCCQNLGYQKGDFPVTERYADQILSLPMFPELSPEAIEYVAEAIKSYVPTYKAELIGK